MGGSQKQLTLPKGQLSISRFFTPRPLPNADTISNLHNDDDTSAKRKISGFSHSPSKKPRQDDVQILEENDPKPLKVDRKPLDKPPSTLKDSLSTPQHTSEIVIDDEDEEDTPTDISEKFGLQKFRQKTPETKAKTNVSSKHSSNPKATKKSATKPVKLTPFEQQFKELKSLHMDKILAIQVGYKFKFFGRDAEVAAHLLSIMLIPGNLDLHDTTHSRYAYCSIPDNRLHIHLQRLLNHGLKVGVVKQTETAAVKSVESSNKSSLFERKVTAVYTKATYMGDEAVNNSNGTDTYGSGDNFSESDRYILCIDESQHPGKTGIVAVQPATGDILYDVFTDTLSREELETRLAYLNPSEVIVLGSGDAPSKEVKVALKLQNPAISLHFVPRKENDVVQKALAEFFLSLDSTKKHAEVASFYTENFPEVVQSCVNELVTYLAEFNLSNSFTITSNISSFTESGRYMVLPASTLRALDIFEVNEDPSSRAGTLFWLLNHTQTRKGASMLRSWIGKPLVDKTEIQKRLDAVESLATGEFVHILDSLKSILSKIGKSGVALDKLLIKIHYSATYSTDKITRKQLFMMLKAYNDLIQVFRDFGEKGVGELKEKFAKSELLSDILESLLNASKEKTVDIILAQINGGAALNEKDLSEQKTKFFVHKQNKKYDAITAEFDKIAEIESELEAELKAVRSLLKRPQLAYVTNIKDTHLIEVRNGKMVDSLPKDWLRVSGTKTVSRFRPPAVSRLHKLLQYHNERLVKECDDSFNMFLREIDSEYEYFREIVFNLSRFDCLLSLSNLPQNGGNTTYVKPDLVGEQTINIRSGCHPILSKLPQNSGAYVPNDVSMSYDKNKVLIITGPNMGGKSSLVKQIALFVIMAQVGSFLPCSEATMGIFDSIYIRMGASDNILKGKSTFMVEMSECASIIKNYTPKSLIILDEIGRGTGTSDGIALAYSILKYIIEDKSGPLTLFITHYPSLHVLEQEHKAVTNHHMAFIEKHTQEGEENDWPEVVFLYKLVKGVVSNSYGLNVAKLAGIAKEVIDSAHKMSESMKADVEQGQLLQALSQLTPTNAFEVLSKLF